jgi:hypothetical protein
MLSIGAAARATGMSASPIIVLAELAEPRAPEPRCAGVASC